MDSVRAVLPALRRKLAGAVFAGTVEAPGEAKEHPAFDKHNKSETKLKELRDFGKIL